MGDELSKLNACPKCETEVPKNSKFCLNCGEPVYKGWKNAGFSMVDTPEEIEAKKSKIKITQAQKQGIKKTTAILISGFVVIFVVGIGATIYVNLSGGEEKSLIAILEEEAASSPTNAYEKKVRIYKRLLELRPNNDRYAKLLAYYEDLLFQKKAKGQIDTVLGFDTYEKEIAKVVEALSCQTVETETADEYSSASFSCFSGRDETVVWEIAEGFSENSTQSIKLTWTDHTKGSASGNAHGDREDAYFALATLIDLYAPYEAKKVNEAFLGQERVKIDTNNFVIRYAYSKGVASTRRVVDINKRP